MNTEPNILHNSNISLRTIAITTGIGLLIMAILALIAHMNIFPSLIVTGDSQSTANNINSSIGLFRLGIFFFILVAILDIFAAWGLYVLLKLINNYISLLIAWFRVAYAVILIVSLNNLFKVLQLLHGSDIPKVFETKQIYAQVMLSYNSFHSGWELGMLLFSIHLVGLGLLMIAAKYIPKFLGILIVIAGIGYLIDSVGKILSFNYKYEIALYTCIGEVLLIFWLLWKGIKGFKDIDEKTA